MKTLKDCNEKNNQNVYFVVNGGGHEGKDVKVGRALMLEIDKDEQGNLIPIDDQYKIMVDKFGIPTVAVFTGNKSLHCYYTYEEPIDPQLWEEMQDDALAYFPITDQSIKDLPRILRLVGFKHSKTGRYSEVYAESGIKYSYDELRSKIPRKTVETEKKKPVVKGKKAQKAAKQAVPNTASELIKINNRDTTPWSKMPYPPLDENGDLISVKCEIPNLYLAESLKLLTYEEIQEILTIKTALEVLPEEYCEEYSKWRETLCAIKSAALKYPDLYDHLLELADTWSMNSDKFDPKVFEDKWDEIDINGNLTTASLIKWAKDAVDNGSYNCNGETTFWELFNQKYPWSYQNYKNHEARDVNTTNDGKKIISEADGLFKINPDSCLTPEDFRSNSNIKSLSLTMLRTKPGWDNGLKIPK
ncbi:MAG: PriCT-2 domain-containing protein [Cyanobacteria bacterium P01_A01_bin.84]